MEQVYIAKPEFIDELKAELIDIKFQHETLFIAAKQPRPVFALDVWLNPTITPITSIGDAAKQLKAVQALWQPFVGAFARRTLLIAEKLPYCKKVLPLTFPVSSLPSIGQYTLLDKDTLLYASEREKVVPAGEYRFIEDKFNPPNRAYLKLWEALAILNRYPDKNHLALDLGAAPGGWTYVLSSLGAKVIAIDKAPLDPKIAARSNVEERVQSAFALQPNDVDRIDWWVCDIACYPQKMYDYLLPWIESGKVGQFIVTIKLQGKTDFEALKKFQKIKGGAVMHLYNNKHEVTFFYPFKSIED